ncbi:unnamed protein product, partial [Choristocarpus tenellus]
IVKEGACHNHTSSRSNSPLPESCSLGGGGPWTPSRIPWTDNAEETGAMMRGGMDEVEDEGSVTSLSSFHSLESQSWVSKGHKTKTRGRSPHKYVLRAGFKMRQSTSDG